ncbi:hypothetical protein AVEN_16297-1 [Araneus ventricosus]|uniref:RNase H type-1 domain-containing protein n=1 Tax=Araneus ventricosus TaxID=182803 RepID=A0A4Y2VIA4_ARAVE|nr:hypothetical protein AVEN_16297-1 [Araneus ventricosus]
MICEIDSKLRGVNDGSVSTVTDFELEEKIIPWDVLRINWNLYKNMSSSFSVFTDGSKMNNRVGSAYVIYCCNDEIDFSMFRLSDNSSVFMAEAFAISKAVDEIIFRKMEYVDLITDSRSKLMSLYSLKEKRCFINNIKRKIVNCEGRINLKWVKAHEGTMGNERADFLGKLAIDKEEIDICFVCNRGRSTDLLFLYLFILVCCCFEIKRRRGWHSTVGGEWPWMFGGGFAAACEPWTNMCLLGFWFRPGLELSRLIECNLNLTEVAPVAPVPLYWVGCCRSDSNIPGWHMPGRSSIRVSLL